jgi:uncharacterized protein YdaU (DUF1376 family)
VNYYERHLGDIAKDTSHLSQGEQGAYDLLMDWYYANECAIPVDKVCRICRARTPQEHRNAIAVATEFFVLVDGRYVHSRIEEEIAKYRDKSRKAATSARLRWEKERNANASKTHEKRICESDAHQSPDTSNQSTNILTDICMLNKIKALKDIDFSGWPTIPTNPTMLAWLVVRKQKRLAVTQPAMDMLIPELNKAQLAGFSAESCIWYAAAKSWGGFRFAWMRRDMIAGNNPPNMPQNLLEKLTDRSWADSTLVDAHDEGTPE